MLVRQGRSSSEEEEEEEVTAGTKRVVSIVDIFIASFDLLYGIGGCCCLLSGRKSRLMCSTC